MTTTQSTTERAQETASAAADEGRHVAGVAKDEAAAVASEAVDHARNLVGDAVGQLGDQVNEQTRTQRDRLVGSLRTLGDDLERMAGQGGTSGLATDLAREVADRSRALGARLDGREPAELLDDVRRFARNRPGVFLLGALAAGVVAGRVLRGAKDGTSSGPSTTPSTPSFADPAPTTSLHTDAPMGTPAAGYGERGTLGEERP